jgi:hypothetical protein
MPPTLRAGLLYFAMVMGTGFCLGTIRVLFVVPRLGQRWAELAEMPLMGTAIYLSAGYILKRFPEIQHPSRSLAAGVLALGLSITAELGLAVIIQNQPLMDYIASRDKVSGIVYLLMLIAFALMPRLRLRVGAKT